MFLSSRLPNRLPPPIQHSNESGFSEGAARALLTHLSGDIGVREQGMTTNEIDTPNFLVETIQSMQAVAQKNGWRLHVEVETVSGALDYYFVHTQFTNVYNNLTNVVVSLSPETISPDQPAFLLGAHYDSAFRSPGVSDDGVSVVVILETIRCLVNQKASHYRNRLVAVLNGAEESYLIGSHAFVKHHPWATHVVGFINLEAMGSGGAEILFQATPGKDWVLREYAALVLFLAFSLDTPLIPMER